MLYSLFGGRKEKISADLTLANLSALKAASGDDASAQEGKYVANGKDPQRVRSVLKSQKAASGCKCKKQSGAHLFFCAFYPLQSHCDCLWVFCLTLRLFRCWKNVAFKTLMQVCLLFWSLSKPGQDALLWSLQSNSMQGDGSDNDNESDESNDSSGSSSSCNNRHVQWYIGGTRVCRRAFLRMLGVGCGRVNRTRDRFQGLDEHTLAGRGRAVNSFSVSIQLMM